MSRLAIASMFLALASACDDGPPWRQPEPSSMREASALEGRCAVASREIEYGPSDDAMVTPPLSSPEALPVDEAADLFGDDLVVGVVLGSYARAYPLRVLARHELIEDRVGARRIAIVHAPLAGASTVFDLDASRLDGGLEPTGGHFDGDVVFRDEETGSLWSHLCRAAVAGPRRGEPLEAVESTVLTLDAWTSMHPETTVVTTDTGFRDIDYDGDAYAWYRRDPNRLGSPLRYRDLRLPMKEPVLGVRLEPGTFRACPLSRLPEQGIVQEELDGAAPLVLSDRSRGLVVAFDRTVEGRALHFELIAVEGDRSALRDLETGSTWTWTGRALEGPMAGAELRRLDEGPVLWLAWAAFRQGTTIFTEADTRPSDSIQGGTR